METKDLTQARKVREASSEQFANQLINDGWVLVAIAHGKDEQEYPIIRYAFAWFEEAEPALR